MKHDAHCERQLFPGRTVCECASRAYQRDPYTPDDLEAARLAHGAA